MTRGKVEGRDIQLLLDTGAQVTTVAASFLAAIGCPIRPIAALPQPPSFEGSGGLAVPILGYTVIQLGLYAMKYDKPIVAFVVPDSPFTRKVPVTVGTNVIGPALGLMTETEAAALDTAWKVTHGASREMMRCCGLISTGAHPFVVLSKKAVLRPLSTTIVEARIKGWRPQAALPLIIEPKGCPRSDCYEDCGTTWTTENMYAFCKADEETMPAVIRNHTLDTITLPKGTDIGTVGPVYQIYNPPPPLGEDNALGSEDTCSLLAADIATHITQNWAQANAPETNPLVEGDSLAGTGYEMGPGIFTLKELNLRLMSVDDAITKGEAVSPDPKLTIPARKKLIREEIDAGTYEQVTPEEVTLLGDLLEEFQDVFALDKGEIGHTNLVRHRIEITNDEAFKERYRRIPPNQMAEVKTVIDGMISEGAVRRSSSPWSNAMVLVRKKDGKLRPCIDFRKLNERTVKDAYPLPRMDETIDQVAGSEYFTSMDMKSGYWQVEMDEDSKKLTAFTAGPLGFYECDRMPFGLCNAPATFQRLMETAMGEIYQRWCSVYLDDLLTHSRSVSEHLIRLRAVLGKLRAAGLKLKLTKCIWMKRKVVFLSHVVTPEGISPQPEKVEGIKEYPPPTTVSGVRRFLGMAGHYRRYVKNFSRIAEPLRSLTGGESSELKETLLGDSWTPACTLAFEQLKTALGEAPVLAFADYDVPFRVTTDASLGGLGAVLSQISPKDGLEHPVAFSSRALNDAEKNYPAHKLEFLALKWAVTDQYKDYLYGSRIPFAVETDNNPLTYAFTTARLDATGHRWVAALANYNFSIGYKKGSQNVVADALSRVHCIEEEPGRDDQARPLVKFAEGDEARELDVQGVSALLNAAVTPAGVEPHRDVPCLAELLGEVEREAKDAVIVKAAHIQRFNIAGCNWEAAQKQDPNLAAIIRWLKEGCKGVARRDGPAKYASAGTNNDLNSYNGDRASLVLKNGLAYRRRKDETRNLVFFQFLVPHGSRGQAIKGCHEDVGHPGRDRTRALLKERFHWPTLMEDAAAAVKNCKMCLALNSKGSSTKAPLHPIAARMPMELIHVDFLRIEVPPVAGKSPSEFRNILVISDHYTRFAVAILCRDQTAASAAKALWDGFFMSYGFPEKIITDQGKAFESRLFRELCALAGTQKLRTTAYHPQTNGQVERLNKTILRMLRRLTPDHKAEWENHLATLVHAYNCTRSEVTGYSPFYLMFGRRPRIAVDSQFPCQPTDGRSIERSKYVKEMAERLRTAHKVAEVYTKAAADKNKRDYDGRATAIALEPGDVVMIRENYVRGRQKLGTGWMPHDFEVLNRYPRGLPVYRLKDIENGTEIVRHRNQLLPLILHNAPGASEELRQSREEGAATDKVETENGERTPTPTTSANADPAPDTLSPKPATNSCRGSDPDTRIDELPAPDKI